MDDDHAHGDPRDGGDSERLISVGALPYGHSGFRPQDVADLEEIATVHLYPKVGEHDRSVRDAAEAKPDGQPLILDETGPWGGGDVSAFILGTSESAAGWVGHYFERTPAEILSYAGRRSATTGTSASTRHSCASRRR